MPVAAQSQLPPFQSLVDAHARAVAAFLRGMLRPEDVDDALQETFLAALRAYPRFDGSNPRAWLLTIARRKAIDEGRAASRRPEALADPDAMPAGAASAEVPPRSSGRRSASCPRSSAPRWCSASPSTSATGRSASALECSEAAARRSVHEGLKSLRTKSRTNGLEEALR